MEVDGASEPLLVVESAGPNGFAPVREIGRADAIATFGTSGREATEVGPLSFFPCVILLTLFLVIEGIEAPRYRFCIGVQWHPEFLISDGDVRLFRAFLNAAAK